MRRGIERLEVELGAELVIEQPKAPPLGPRPGGGVVVQHHGLEGRRRALPDRVLDPRPHEPSQPPAAVLPEHPEANRERVPGERGLVDEGHRDDAAFLLTRQVKAEPHQAVQPAPELLGWGRRALALLADRQDLFQVPIEVDGPDDQAHAPRLVAFENGKPGLGPVSLPDLEGGRRVLGKRVDDP